MAWLTEYSDTTNKVITSERTWTEQLYWPNGVGTPVLWERDVTETNYSYVGMTYDAAVTCATAISNPPNTIATVARENAGGAYKVDVTATTYTAWS